MTNSRRVRILRVFSSIAVGIMAFCLLFPAAMIFGALLLEPQQGNAFFSQQEVNLFFGSMLMALIVAVSAGTRYYKFLEKKSD